MIPKNRLFSEKSSRFFELLHTFLCLQNAHSFENKIKDFRILGIFPSRKLLFLWKIRKLSPFSNIFCLTTFYALRPVGLHGSFFVYCIPISEIRCGNHYGTLACDGQRTLFILLRTKDRFDIINLQAK